MVGKGPGLFRSILDDQRLIKECSNYAQSLAAFDAEFSAHPDANKVENVVRRPDPSGCSAGKNRGDPAKTAEGIHAKARIVAMVMRTPWRAREAR